MKYGNKINLMVTERIVWKRKRSQKETQTREYKLKVARWMWFNAARGSASDANYITSKTQGLDWRMEAEGERVVEGEEGEEWALSVKGK